MYRSSLYSILAFALYSTTVAAQGIVNNGAQLVVSAGTSVTVHEGGIANAANATITNNGTVSLDSDYAQSGAGANYLGTGWLVFDGTSDQNISGVDTVPKLNLNNGNQLVLGSDLIVSDSMKLNNNSTASIANRTLTIAPTAKLTGYGPNAFVRTGSTGTLKRQVASASGAVDFPVGRSSYNLATITNSGTTDVFAVRATDVVYDDGTNGIPKTSDVVDRTWMIEEQVAGGSNVTLELRWLNTEELTGFDRSQSGIAHFDGTSWADPPTVVAATDEGSGFWSQRLTGVTSFSPFAVEDNDFVLPIELLSFSARNDGPVVALEWVTASELNNDYFEVERSADGMAFAPVVRQTGAGTSSTELHYTDIDRDPLPGWSYYRLKQVDFDGKLTYSQVEAIYRPLELTDKVVTVYPNPTRYRATIEGIPANSVVTILSATGAKVADAQLQGQILHTANLASGIYFLRLAAESTLQRLVIIE